MNGAVLLNCTVLLFGRYNRFMELYLLDLKGIGIKVFYTFVI